MSIEVETQETALLDLDFLRSAMDEAAGEVFTTMLNQTASHREPAVRQSIEHLSDGVLALVGLTGDWVGSGALSCPAASARWMSSQMMMCDYDEVSDEVLDAVGELCNMIIGNFKNKLAERTGPLAMSVPAVVYGQRMRTNSRGGGKDWMAFPLTCGEHSLELLVQLQPKSN